MATQYYNFKGTLRWGRLNTPDDMYKNYYAEIYMDEAEATKVKASGLQLKFKEDENGHYVKFRRPETKEIKNELVKFEAPKVTLNGEPYEGIVGNGSLINLNVVVYDTRKGKGHRLNSVEVLELVEYTPPATEDTPRPETVTAPATGANRPW